MKYIISNYRLLDVIQNCNKLVLVCEFSSIFVHKKSNDNEKRSRFSREIFVKWFVSHTFSLSQIDFSNLSFLLLQFYLVRLTSTTILFAFKITRFRFLEASEFLLSSDSKKFEICYYKRVLTKINNKKSTRFLFC